MSERGPLIALTLAMACAPPEVPDTRIKTASGQRVQDCARSPVADTRTWPIPTSGAAAPDETTAVTLAPPIAVGRDKHDNVYVVDRVGGDSAWFVGSKGTLTRGHGGGLTEAAGPYTWYEFGTAERPFILRVERDAKTPGRVGPRHFAMTMRNPGRPAKSPAESMCLGEQLEILGPEVIEGWKIAAHGQPR